MFDIVFEALLAAYKNHVSLGEKGKVKDKKNRFGDMAMRGDVEAEEKITQVLKRFADKNNIKIVCKSEELGNQELNPKGKEIYLAIFDGLDGSKNYLEKGGWSYGTMLALSKSEDPNYEDFEVAGISMMEEGKILVAQKGVGTAEFDAKSLNKKEIKKFNKDEAFDYSKILANKVFPEELEALGKNADSWPMTASTAASITAICTDPNWQGLIEVTRKNNLEQPILFTMIGSLGGVMVDENGNSIEKYNFKSWGQKKADGSEDRRVVVTARNRKIAIGILKELDRA